MCGQTGCISSAEGQQLHRTIPFCSLLQGAVFFKNGMEVGAAKPKGADTGAARGVVAADPGPFAGGDVERGAASSDFILWFGDLDGGGDDPVVQGQGSLDQAGRPGSSLGMADLGLN